MKRPRVGKLNTRIQFQRETVSADGYGGFTSTGDTTTQTCWAKYDIIKSDIKDEFGHPQNELVGVFIVRKNSVPGIKPGDIIKIDGTAVTYKINKSYEVMQNDYYKFEGTRV
jgi:hypothetical protein